MVTVDDDVALAGLVARRFRRQVVDRYLRRARNRVDDIDRVTVASYVDRVVDRPHVGQRFGRRRTPRETCMGRGGDQQPEVEVWPIASDVVEQNGEPVAAPRVFSTRAMFASCEDSCQVSVSTRAVQTRRGVRTTARRRRHVGVELVDRSSSRLTRPRSRASGGDVEDGDVLPRSVSRMTSPSPIRRATTAAVHLGGRPPSGGLNWSSGRYAQPVAEALLEGRHSPARGRRGALGRARTRPGIETSRGRDP